MNIKSEISISKHKKENYDKLINSDVNLTTTKDNFELLFLTFLYKRIWFIISNF